MYQMYLVLEEALRDAVLEWEQELVAICEFHGDNDCDESKDLAEKVRLVHTAIDALDPASGNVGKVLAQVRQEVEAVGILQAMREVANGDADAQSA